ncbi:hypothetical protein [Cytobacillus dafuensis]|uniref:Uncharacterized protein n=1 Tax=Cytobacillus dafuensis TaxID=1742359 RepID=A0A5B8Z4U6_CYTDA|nr:hypothetical protein [Cytobacillus dafuensis]QED46659.1 hypothetical protein FSZ17_04860 [Cytobacillus dafuensis]
MKYILNLNKHSKIIIAGLGLSIIGFVTVFLGNDSEGVVTYEEYLQAIQEPYQNLYKNLHSLPEKPASEEIHQIYDKFERDISKIKISTDAEKNVRANYQQLTNLPTICREDYEKSPYKYSTLVGQASNVKMVLDYIEKNQSFD